MRSLIAESLIDLPDELPPMAAGLVGYMGYDMVRLMEKLPPPNDPPLTCACADEASPTSEDAATNAARRMARIDRNLRMPAPGGSNSGRS